MRRKILGVNFGLAKVIVTLLVSITYGHFGGGGDARLTRRPFLRGEPGAVPEGTRLSFRGHPALKRWAIPFRPSGARVARESCVRPNWADRQRRRGGLS